MSQAPIEGNVRACCAGPPLSVTVTGPAHAGLCIIKCIIKQERRENHHLSQAGTASSNLAARSRSHSNQHHPSRRPQ
jgi:hypothetical protein